MFTRKVLPLGLFIGTVRHGLETIDSLLRITNALLPRGADTQLDWGATNGELQDG